ncbi:hypothetical protein [Capnocytophaga leadbetteri]|jgi:hypothetical protein|uniref:hypothetical protein n=1 Tax=Capnocytophaga leadbetteri TaxID=327575 RepID=UPI0026EC0696|nr:hypothetical protein [Capnocytophaga leadbetteri]
MKEVRKLANEKISKLIASAAYTCPHKHKELRTLAHYVTVEVTALFCTECGKQLTKEEWNV